MLSNAPWNREPVFCLTCDVDWASEAALDRTMDLFRDLDVRPTVFNTHPSPLLDRLAAEGGVDLGIHPNFLPGSSQGEGFEAVVDYLAKAVPGASCFRSHRYFDVTDTNVMLAEHGFTHDANLFSFLCKLPPHRHFSGLIRFPTWWEDGTWLRNVGSLDPTGLTELFAPGLTILSVHPMHMAMNSPDFAYARQVKDRVTREEWTRMDLDDLAKVTHTGRGIRDFFADVAEAVLAKGYAFHTLGQLHDTFLQHEAS